MLLLRQSGKIDVGGHAGAEVISVSGQADFDAEDLFDAVFDSLDVAGGELGDAGDLFDFALEIPVWKGIDADAGFVTDLEVAKPGFGNIDAQPEVRGEQKRCYRCVGGKNIAGFDVEGFNHGASGSVDFKFANLGVDFGKLRFGLGNAFGAGSGKEQVVTTLRSGEAFLEAGGLGNGAIAIAGGDSASAGKLGCAFLFGAGEFEIGGDGFHFGFGGGEFFFAGAVLPFGEHGGGLVAASFEFRSFETEDELVVGHGISFAHEDVDDTSAVAGSET